MTELTPRRMRPDNRASVLRLSIAALCLTLLGGCFREDSGQTAILLALTTRGPVDCVVLTEKPTSGGAGLTQTLSGSSLPAEFSGAGWKTARGSALVYSGGSLGSGTVTLQAEGHRGSCSAPVVARFGPASARFAQGQVVQLPAELSLLAVDADGDGFSPPEDCNDNDPTIYPGAPELCDGKDHSCSGVPDKGCACGGGSRPCYPLGLDSATLQHGTCRAGTQTCVSGKWSGLCAGAVTPEPERCDAQDHDCDGNLGLPSCPCTPGTTRQCYTKGPQALAGVGRCSYGEQTCSPDGFFGPCLGDVGPLPYELCNGVDDNCDGRVDEDTDGQGKPILAGRPACGNQQGVCAGSKATCHNGAFAACGTAEYSASATAHGTFYGAEPQSCDGIDHDCNGVIGGAACQACNTIGGTRDCYGPGLGSPTLSHGTCHKGTQTCIRNNANALVWSACANEQDPAQELCDLKDNDCNGLVDDLPQDEGKPCGTGLPGVCSAGYQHCASGSMSCAPLIPATTEICDGLDNDCNGRIDDPWDKQNDPQHCGGTYDCRACATGNSCCTGRCADLSSDALNCGACGHACGNSQGCCAGKCVDLAQNGNCGACGKVCPDGTSCKANGACAPAHETICNNGVDDDLDGLTDCQDPDCQGQVCDQTGGTCNGNTCQHETNCRDRQDNDGDGKIDCADPDCTGKRCDNKFGLCTASGACIQENCTNGIDDNGDGKIDCQDTLACPPPGAMAQPVCCGSTWVDSKTDVHHCGGCGTDCTAGHSNQCGSIACVNGACSYGNAGNRTPCQGGVCCNGACVADREVSCTNGQDDNCDGKTDCQDAVACPAPGGAVNPQCCSLAWTDADHGDPSNCGSCGRICPAPGAACAVAVCNAGGACGIATDCTIPGCDGAACTQPGGGAGKCAGGACCAGCVDSTGTCQAGNALHSCLSGTGACEDCRPSENACISDTCTSSGCQHAYNTNACTVNGAPGFCNLGVCCPANSCLDANGACQPIGLAHCGVSGGACQAQSCDDLDSCTADSCGADGLCHHLPQNVGGACTDGSASGKCDSAGVCCLGCLSGGACVQPAAETPAACGASGANCGACAAPPNECQVSTCTAPGTCGFANKPGGTSCNNGAGVCAYGSCVSCGGNGNACGASACCPSGYSCQNGACGCDTGICPQQGGVCYQNQCVVPSDAACAANGKKFCPGGGGSCVAACSSCGGGASATCGGNTCLVPGSKGTSNICSDGVHPESCDYTSLGGGTSCSCDDAAHPGTCPSNGMVCANIFLVGNHCKACGDSNTNGLLCKGGGTCNQTARACN